MLLKVSFKKRLKTGKTTIRLEKMLCSPYGALPKTHHSIGTLFFKKNSGEKIHIIRFFL
jgi:hypothetical protein